MAPGFVNMMSSPETLLENGRSQSDIRQGVMLEIFGRCYKSTKFFAARVLRASLLLFWGQHEIDPPISPEHVAI